MNRLLLNQKVRKRDRRTMRDVWHHSPMKTVQKILLAVNQIRSDIVTFAKKNITLPQVGIGALIAALIPLLTISLIQIQRHNENARGPRLVEAAIEQVSTADFEPVDGGEEIDVLDTGSGIPLIDREHDYIHEVAGGETLSGIAYLYKIETAKLAVYNGIEDINEIHAGDVIKVPSIAKVFQIAQQQNVSGMQVATVQSQAENKASLPTLEISASEQYDGFGVTAHFSIQSPKDVKLSDFVWTLGEGRKSFRPNTVWTYTRPGTHTIQLEAKTPSGEEIQSNKVQIVVPQQGSYKAEYQKFITLNNIDEEFLLEGKLISVFDYPSLEEAPIEKIQADYSESKYKFTESGYFNLEVEKNGVRSDIYVFVSPVESIHVDRDDFNWYRTQFNTGSQSNCGPSTVSMAYAWATGEYKSVAAVRDQIGWDENIGGATTLEELYKALYDFGVPVGKKPLNDVDDIFEVIARGSLAIVLLETGKVTEVESDPLMDFFGRYYSYTEGHYIVVKGYSKDKDYFIVYDPIPSDWSSNSLRYSDGISMMGRNRYYKAEDLYNAIKARRSNFIEVRQAN